MVWGGCESVGLAKVQLTKFVYVEWNLPIFDPIFVQICETKKHPGSDLVHLDSSSCESETCDALSSGATRTFQQVLPLFICSTGLRNCNPSVEFCSFCARHVFSRRLQRSSEHC